MSSSSPQACRDFLELAETHSRKWQRALQYEREQRIHLEETIEQLAKQHNNLERACRGAPSLASNTVTHVPKGGFAISYHLGGAKFLLQSGQHQWLHLLKGVWHRTFMGVRECLYFNLVLKLVQGPIAFHLTSMMCWHGPLIDMPFSGSRERAVCQSGAQ